MSTGHNIMDMLNQQSKAGVADEPRGRFRTKDIPIAQMYRNERNFYAVQEVEELAGKILMCGLLENLAVTYDPTDAGDYRIISGERRWEALKLLVSQGHDAFVIATCQIRPKKSDEEENIELIAANAQRIKSTGDVLEEERRLKLTLESMKAKNMKLNGVSLQEGKLRDVIASILDTSPTRIAQMEVINNNLIPELRNRVMDGALDFSTAYELAGMNKDQQHEYLHRIEDGAEVRYKDVKAAKDEQKAQQEIPSDRHEDTKSTEQQENTTEIAGDNTESDNTKNPWIDHCPETGHDCNHYEEIKTYFMRNGQLENCAGCCAACIKDGDCPHACDTVRFSKPQEPQAVDAHPQHINALCYSCGNWSGCIEKAGTVTTCDKYIKTNATPQPEQQPATTSQTAKCDPYGEEALIAEIRRCISIESTHDLKNRCQSLFTRMAEYWQESGAE